MMKKYDWVLKLSFLLAVIATAGSLYFSDVLKLPPCVLCWYQRICMYPLVVIFGVTLFNNTRDTFKYSLAFSLIGLAISSYHNLLYYGIIPDSITPCSEGVSCTSKQIELLGFVTIPLLAFVSFSLMTVLSFIGKKVENEK
jgi:disulfide bond formation protein DsbB